MLSPKSSVFLIFITLSKAFLTIEYESPAKISPRVLPSFCICFILEFINTVHLVPRSTGILLCTASSTKESIGILSDLVKVSIKEPHPDEQASLSIIVSI